MISRLIDLFGVAVFAASGTLAAGRKRLDVLGVLVVAAVTAIGGGTLRDLLLNRHPVFWIADPIYLLVITVAALGTMASTRSRRPPGSSLAIADALGLSFFAISGAQVAQAAGLAGIIAVLMGTMTGVAGGVIRDVLTAEIPMVLTPRELYASAAIAGTTLYLLLEAAGTPRLVASLVGMALIFALRVASIVWGIKLPAFTVKE